jgi:hypothetical protein
MFSDIIHDLYFSMALNVSLMFMPMSMRACVYLCTSMPACVCNVCMYVDHACLCIHVSLCMSFVW